MIVSFIERGTKMEEAVKLPSRETFVSFRWSKGLHLHAHDIRTACEINDGWDNSWSESLATYCPNSEYWLEFRTTNLANAVPLFRAVYRVFRQLLPSVPNPNMKVIVHEGVYDERRLFYQINSPAESELFQEILRLYEVLWKTAHDLKATRKWIRDEQIDNIRKNLEKAVLL